MSELSSLSERIRHDARAFSSTAFFCLFVFLWVFSSFQPAFAQTKGNKPTLQQQERKAKEQKDALSRLNAQEKELQEELKRYQNSLRAAEADLKKAEQNMAALEREEKGLQREYTALLKAKAKTTAEMSRLLGSMWQVYIQSKEVGGQSIIPDWDKADREFIWSSELYRQARAKMDLIQRQEAQLEEVLGGLRRLNQEANARLEQANKSKDVVLKTRLDHMRELDRLRKEKLDREAELGKVLEVIQSLNYTLERESVEEKRRQAMREAGIAPPKSTDKKPEIATPEGPGGSKGKAPGPAPITGGNFAGYKGRLPWPANGVVARKFNPSASPPRRGLGLSLSSSSPVKAVFGGRVVHNEILRGFGRVVIVLHSGSYYSLYAFLNSSKARVGQQVAAGQEIGSAGYYPDLNGPGLYFELRFRQKPINPEQWLAAKK